MARHVAFLRGINLGSTRKVAMGELRSALEEIGFTDVRTLLNSGNVAFDAAKVSAKVSEGTIEKKLEETFGFPIGVIVRSQAAIQKIVRSNPFKGVKERPETRRSVTFLKDAPRTALKLPYRSSSPDFEILKLAENALFWVVHPSATTRTPDVMSFLDATFGKNVTTRTWNTVVKSAEV